jgi:putative molybdopterin biosynthesis protein
MVDTGDTLPPGADSVIMKELVTVKDGCIELYSPVLQGYHVRSIGEDIMAGETVLPAGRIIGPADIAAALAAGADSVQVMSRPRITVIPTGDEIIDSPEALSPGSIRDINSYMLSALLSCWDAQVRRHRVVPDEPQLLQEAIKRSLAVSDLVVTIAGTSSGTEDFTADVFEKLGRVYCHGVAIRPGRPVLLAAVGGKPVIGLPGYPVSCMLTAELFLRDLLYEYQRKNPPERRTRQAKLAHEVQSRPDVEEFVRVKLTPGVPLDTASVLPRGASLISTLTQADGWLRIAAKRTVVEAGSIIEVELF